MEAKPTTSLYGQTDTKRGAGGKLRKPPARKSLSTPYDRPPSNHHSRSWLLSKVVDPAYRLVATGAAKILPSFFSATPSVAALPPSTENKDNQDVEVTFSAEGNERLTLSDDALATQFSGRSAPSEVGAHINCQSDELGLDEPTSINNDSQFSGIEQLIKGKTFSRNEVNRLMEILVSRASDDSDIEGRKKNEILTTAGRNVEDLPIPFSKASDEGYQQDVNKVPIASPMLVPQTVPDEIGSSPIDIARAYMGSRIPEYGHGPCGVPSKNETPQRLSNEFASKPFIPSSVPRLSTCWPGAMAQEYGYSTPNQRSRHGLPDFPRTPYSRTIYSKPRAKMQGDSMYLNSSSDHFEQSGTPIFGQVNYGNDVLDNSSGSVGPIRRVRTKYASEVRPRGSIFSKSSKDAPSVIQQHFASQTKQPNLQKNLQFGETSTSNEKPGHLSGNRFGNKPVLNPSTNDAVKRILDQLAMRQPTPQEKRDELKLAGTWKKSPSEASGAMRKENISFSHSEELGSLKKTDLFDSKLLSKGNKFGDHSKSLGDSRERSIKAKDVVDASIKASSIVGGDSVKKSDVNTGFLFSFSSTSSQPKSFQEKAGQHIPPKHQISGQTVTTGVPDDSKFEPSKKPPLHSSGTRPNLPHISVGRHDPGRSLPSDNGIGFTFPVSATSSTLSEPPTPSVMPFCPGGIVSQPKDVPTVPAYSFGNEKSTPRLVFSFPSTSNTPTHVDAHDLKFNFGSDKKMRLSFGSVGKDAICY